MKLPERSALTKRPPEEPSESAKTPTNLTRSRSFYYNQIYGRYPMEWAGSAEFKVWQYKAVPPPVYKTLGLLP